MADNLALYFGALCRSFLSNKFDTKMISRFLVVVVVIVIGTCQLPQRGIKKTSCRASLVKQIKLTQIFGQEHTYRSRSLAACRRLRGQTRTRPDEDEDKASRGRKNRAESFFVFATIEKNPFAVRDRKCGELYPELNCSADEMRLLSCFIIHILEHSLSIEK